jgi:hypothetical protein
MKYCLSLGMLLATVVFLTGNSLAADEAGRNIPIARLEYGPSADWNAQFSVAHLPSASVGGESADVGVTDYRFKLTRNTLLNERTTMIFGGGYGLKHLDVSGLTALPQDLHSLYLEAGVNYRFNERSFASLRLMPGFYSDFKDIGGDDLRMPVLALGGYTFDSGISLVGGFVCRFGYHAGQYIPALGVSYQPNQNWKFDLIAPRPAITYFASRQLQFFVGGDFSSDEYELKDHSLGAKVIKYSDLKAMGGCNYLPTKNMKVITSVGYAFERRFMFFDGNRNDLRVDDVPFFRVALELGW